MSNVNHPRAEKGGQPHPETENIMSSRRGFREKFEMQQPAALSMLSCVFSYDSSANDPTLFEQY